MDATLSLLTGEDAEHILASAVQSVGGRLLRWRTTLVDHRPAVSTTVAYQVTVGWGDEIREETLAASWGLADDDRGQPGVLTLGDGQRRVSVWRFPSDPGLPALEAAVDRRAVAGLLGSLGLSGVAEDGSDLQLRTRTYRPRRRAVIEVRGAGSRLFLKVLRPGHAADLHRRHRMLHDAGLPVPRSLGWTDDGLLVLTAIAGEPARARILGGGHVPSGRHITDLLDRLPPQAMELPLRRPWSAHAGHYARILADALPDEGQRVADLAARVAAGLVDQQFDRPTHGDFYEAQLLLEDDIVSGLLDVDTVGPGRRADDLACLLAHAHVLALQPGAQPARILRIVEEWQRWFERAVDPVELRLRTAGVLLSLATGPHRVQEAGWPQATVARVDAVEQWVDAADSGGRA